MDIGLPDVLFIVGIAVGGLGTLGESMNPWKKSGGQYDVRGISLGKASVLLATANCIECGVGREVWIGETDGASSGLDSASSEAAG